MNRLVATTMFGVLATLTALGTAHAGPNDVTIHRFGECRVGAGCPFVDTRDDDFYRLARDIGLVFSPTLNTGGETLGPAGFAVQLDQNIAVVNSTEPYWVDGNIDQDPSGTLMVTQLRLRKGLPLSLELGGVLSMLWQSQMLAVGAEVRWALHEDFLWPVPDFAVRGYVNTVVGNSDFNVITSGVEFVAGLPIGIGNVMNLTPYAGYNLGVIIMSSRLVDATPLDPRPPEDNIDQPEFVFDMKTELVHQGLLGARLQFAPLNVGFQAQFGSDVQVYSVSLGAEF